MGSCGDNWGCKAREEAQSQQGEGSGGDLWVQGRIVLSRGSYCQTDEQFHGELVLVPVDPIVPS
jgi:hypothetical protein